MNNCICLTNIILLMYSFDSIICFITFSSKVSEHNIFLNLVNYDFEKLVFILKVANKIIIRILLRKYIKNIVSKYLGSMITLHNDAKVKIYVKFIA